MDYNLTIVVIMTPYNMSTRHSLTHIALYSSYNPYSRFGTRCLNRAYRPMYAVLSTFVLPCSLSPFVRKLLGYLRTI